MPLYDYLQKNSQSSTPSKSHRKYKRLGTQFKSKQDNKEHLQQYQQYFPQNIKKRSIYYKSPNDSSMTGTIRSSRSIESNSFYTSLNNQSAVNNFKKIENQNNLLVKQIQKLKIQIQKKQKQIKQLEGRKYEFKELESELVETYRVINYYEGKVKQLQKTIEFHQKNYHQAVLSTQKSKNNLKLKENLDFKSVLQYFRNQSVQLHGQVEKQNYETEKLKNQIKKWQNKCLKLQKSLVQKSKSQKILHSYQTANLTGSKDIKTSLYETKLQASKQNIGTRRADDQLSNASSAYSQNSKRLRPQRKNALSKSKIIQQNYESSKIYGNFNSKINKIEQELDFFKFQNSKIADQLNQKIIQLGKLKLQNDELKFLLDQKNSHKELPKQFRGRMSQDQLNKVIVLPKNLLKVVQPLKKSTNSIAQSATTSGSTKKPSQFRNLSLQQLSKKIVQNRQKKYIFTQIKRSTIRKLRYNIIRQNITYSKLIDLITEKLVSSDPNQLLQILEDVPYQLNSQETSQFIFQNNKIHSFIKAKQIESQKKQPKRDLSKQANQQKMYEEIKQILKQNIPLFKNLTIRRDATVSSRISNVFKNRQEETKLLSEQFGNKKAKFQDLQKVFQNSWGLSFQQIDYIFLKSCEQSCQYHYFDFQKTIQFFVQN